MRAPLEPALKRPSIALPWLVIDQAKQRNSGAYPNRRIMLHKMHYPPEPHDKNRPGTFSGST